MALMGFESLRKYAPRNWMGKGIIVTARTRTTSRDIANV